MPLFSGMDRSKLRNAVYPILILAFFFAVGLAGGVLYRVLPTSKTPAQPETKLAEESTSTGSTMNDTSASSATPAATSTPQVPATPAPTAATPAPTAASPEIAPSTPETAPQTTPAAESQPAPKPAKKPAAKQAEARVPPSGSTPPAPEAKTPATAPAPKPPAAHQEAAKPARDVKTASTAPTAKPAPPHQAAAASKPAAKHASGDLPPFRIQFGAFAIEGNAHRTQWAVEATGVAVEVTRAPTRKGRMLYYVRSQPFPTRAAALAAAIAAHDKAKKFTHPVTIEYVVLNNAMIAAEEGRKPSAPQP